MNGPMKYMYGNASFPVDDFLLSQINSAAEKLHRILSGLDLPKVGISEYNQRYLGSKLSNPVGNLQIYTNLLSLSLSGGKTPLDKFTFVDYGGGSGVMSLLAKQLGIGRVVYCDIYSGSCKDVKVLSEKTGIPVDDIVCGDIEDLIAYVRKGSIYIDSITSFDVIEHIYDIDSYLRKLRLLSDYNFRVVLASGANIRNPLIFANWTRHQLIMEYREKERKWGTKETESTRSYLAIRKDIIKKFNSSLRPETVDRLAKRTRGLRKDDVEKSVREFVETGKISYRPDRTNTCDPITGNYQEHLMESERLQRILAEEGFNVKIMSGYWKTRNRYIFTLIMNIMNLGIRHLGKNALFFSPYFVVFADYNRPDHP
ncbi:MAG: methyltransferase domain-containing protein [Candidatus Omnitrophota bacterium]